LNVVWYLLRDLLWRSRVTYALFGPMMCLVWFAFALNVMEPRWGVTFSLFMAAAVGPMTSISLVGLREIRILPIRFRDLWALTWLASTVVPSLFVFLTASVGVAMAMAFGQSPVIGLGMPVLLGIYSYVFTNAVLVLLPALNYTSRNMRPGATTTALMCSILFLFLASMAVPYFLAPYLPVSFGQLSGASIAMLATGIAASFGVLAWRPTTGIGTAAVNRGQAARLRTSPRAADSLTGLSRVLVPYWFVASVLTGIAVGGSVWYVSKNGSGDVAAFLGENVSSMAFMLIGMISPWMPWARVLKSLPLRAAAINLLLLSTPLVTWCVVGGTLLLTEPIAGPTVPVWFTPSVLLCFAGASALTNALAFRHQGAVHWVIGPAAVTSPFVRGAAERASASGDLWFVAAGLLVFGLTAWINQRTLTRCGSASRAFRRPTAGMFSANGPVAPRL
jgi:hypothetical protein